MDNSKFEVGDVVRHNDREIEVSKVMEVDLGQGRIRAVKLDGAWVSSGIVELVRKADPYAGITLPAPPAGYRLAKWGEGVPIASLWWDCSLSLWTHEWVRTEWPRDNPQSAIFAIALDQPSPLKSWQFREVPWVALEPKTLADAVDNVPVIATHPYCVGCIVLFRKGESLWYWLPNGNHSPLPHYAKGSEYKFVRYLDPPPQKPLSLEDVPDGRVILCDGDYYWRSGMWYRQNQKTGAICFQSYPRQEFTITHHIAEFRGPA